MSINPLNDISRVYLEQVAAVEEGVRPTPVDKPLDKAAFKKRRRSLAGKEKSAEARSRGHVGKEWYNSGRTYSPDEAKSGRAKLDDEERRTRHRSAVDPDNEDDNNYSADKTKNPKKLRKQAAMGESAVPGKPAEKLGAVTAIPKSEQEAARERILAKTKAKREKMEEERNDEPGEGTRQKYGDMRGLDRSGAPTSFGGKWQSDERKKSGAAALAKLNKEEIEIDEAEEKDPFGRPGGKYGGVKKGGGYDKGYQAMQKKLKELDKVKTEALDPVGQEDADIDNDGDSDKTDKYLHNRRKAIGKAISKNRKKDVKEGFSNWRQDLAEVMTDTESEIKIKEKKVNNKIKINPKLGESVEEIGGVLLEMVEIDEVDFIVESVYDELLEEGYEEDDIEEALEYALTEATVTYGHDTPTGEKKRGNLVKAVGRLARQKLSSKVRGAKTAAKAAVARGARKVAKGALGVARKMEGGKEAPKTAERKPSTYRGAGAGTKERVSSGSYTPSSQKKAEKPADPWEGSSTTPPKAKTKKTAAPKAKAPAASKRKRKSKLDSLLSDIRNEETQLDEKALSKQQQKFMGMVYAVKKGDMEAPSPEVAKAAKSMTTQQAKDFAKTKHKGLPEVKEQMDDSTEMSSTSPTDDKKMEQQKKKIQMQKIRDLTVRLSAARKGVY